ncbi:hypothetical protein [Bacillus toyonensis]|uniref:hypothetical protein n=1 Tax=Bacillus toyonensis TaxID=155322 RepID=UPI002E1FA4AB|nr:hypothetical protein [Bacillus toyonensis]
MKICERCNKETVTIKEKVTHKMFAKEIVVDDVPLAKCECGFIQYIFPKELDFILRDAYRKGLSAVKFEM